MEYVTGKIDLAFENKINIKGVNTVFFLFYFNRIQK